MTKETPLTLVEVDEIHRKHVSIPAYHPTYEEVRALLNMAQHSLKSDDAVSKDSKRKWFEKVRSEEFWKSLTEGGDGSEGEECAFEVYNILYDLYGERG